MCRRAGGRWQLDQLALGASHQQRIRLGIVNQAARRLANCSALTERERSHVDRQDLAAATEHDERLTIGALDYPAGLCASLELKGRFDLTSHEIDDQNSIAIRIGDDCASAIAKREQGPTTDGRRSALWGYYRSRIGGEDRDAA
jgi:hypothetical protein